MKNVHFSESNQLELKSKSQRNLFFAVKLLCDLIDNTKIRAIFGKQEKDLQNLFSLVEKKLVEDIKNFFYFRIYSILTKFEVIKVYILTSLHVVDVFSSIT